MSGADAVKLVNRVLTGLRLEKQPQKTFIGRVEKGFDFLGYRLSPQDITVAEPTWQRFLERALRLYEQAARESQGSQEPIIVRHEPAKRGRS